MTQEAKIILGIGVATVVILFGAVFFLSGNSNNTSTTTKADPKILIKDNSNKLGTDSAKAKLVEFGDYQCPSCAQANPIVKEITSLYGDRVQFIFRHFPLDIHPNARPAAQAAEAAGSQGKYWEMHNLLYENQTQWSSISNPTDTLVGYAKNLGLDTEKFKNEIENQKYAEKIQNDYNDAVSLGVNATPTFYLNEEKLVGVQSYEDLKNRIDSILK